MRMSQAFGKTLRQVPADAETESHKLLLRAGMVTPISAGVYAYLPLGLRVLKRIETIIRQEMDRGVDGGERAGQELLMSSLVPIEFYQQSGRDKTMSDILFTLKDHHDRDFALGPTHEEVFVEVFKRNVQSYRDLPLMLYQIATKFRDEPRPRGGLIRLRQFIMKDLYSFDVDFEGLDISYKVMYDAYLRVFARCGVPVIPALADSGAMGGRDTHEFLYLTDIGEDHCLLCPNCGYAANAEVATFIKETAHNTDEPLPTEEVDTPGLTTIEQLADFLKVPKSKTCKAVFYEAVLPSPEHGRGAGGEGTTTIPVFVAIRGDMDVNEAKLRNALGAIEVRPMDDDAVKKAGLVAGSASAVGLKGMKIVADELVTQERNLVAGANKPDRHLLNTNHGRDWLADVVADIALAAGGMLCANCRTAMDERRGIEMGQVFKLGLKYAEAFEAYFLDAVGKQRPAVMGSYGIGIERLLAAIVEENRDENGIIWPNELAPFDVHLVALKINETGVRETAEKLVAGLQSAGLTVLYDDRDESPGVKFNDADLLGMPVRATVSPRNLENGNIELRLRSGGENEQVSVDAAVAEIKSRLGG